MTERRIIDLPGHRHFVTFSTYQRRRFLDSNRTRDIVLESLQKCLTTHNACCAGFVVMPNHVHAILFGGPGFQISRFIQVWKKTSSYRIKRFFECNLTHYRGLCPENCPIWQTGFYDFNVELDETLLEKLEYIHNNPVKAGLVSTALSWSWSSVRFYEFGEQIGVVITP